MPSRERLLNPSCSITISLLSAWERCACSGGPAGGTLAMAPWQRRSISRILPSNEKFPYTIRIVSEVLESNGSSSMATVCGASLALMDAGVQIKSPAAGIAMGLIKEGEKVVILTDILGDEDHHGDMDFKVAGTKVGITGFQMDIKISGVTREILRQALAQAREGREFILGKMEDALSGPRAELSPYAPRFLSLRIKPDRIREIIGPQGKIIRGIQEETGVKINVEDDGLVQIFSPDSQSAQKAADKIRKLIKEPEVGELYLGRVSFHCPEARRKGVWRLRGDFPGNRWPGPYLPVGQRKSPERRGCTQRGRSGPGEGHRGR